jgi:hypothetical protein
VSRIIYIALSFFLFVCTAAHSTDAFATDQLWKKVTIDGLRVFPENKLFRECGLERFPLNASAFSEAAKRINNFYYQQGYYLAVTYRIEETPDRLSIFVDEGRLGQIIIKGIDDITLVRLKYGLDLDEKVYNRPALDAELERLRKGFGFKEIKATIVEAKDYSRQFLQLDGSFQLPFFGQQRLPIFEQYGYRYNLIIEPSYYSKSDTEKRLRGFEYGIRLGYPGITPQISYTRPSAIVDDDRLRISSSLDVPVSLPNPIKKPSISAIRAGSIYDFVPMFDSLFTPRIQSSVFYSGDSRPDIGLQSFNFIRTNGIMEPGVTLLSHLKIFLGTGLERVFFFNKKDDAAQSGRDLDIRGTHLWKTVSANIELGSYLGLIRPELVRSALASCTWYLDGNTFYRIDLRTHSDFAVLKHDKLTIITKAVVLRGDVPFYYEHPVTDDDFLGFAGSSYYTRAAAKCRIEYISSIYRDFLFVGPYVHGVVFQGSKRDLSGRQSGSAFGITGRYVFWDQFEARIYAGKDHLWTLNRFGTDIMFSVNKKF